MREGEKACNPYGYQDEGNENLLESPEDDGFHRRLQWATGGPAASEDFEALSACPGAEPYPKDLLILGRENNSDGSGPVAPQNT